MFNGRRQPSGGGTSRMTRECQVRFCERLGVKFPGPTRQKCRFSHGLLVRTRTILLPRCHPRSAAQPGRAGFLIFTHTLHRPERYGRSCRFEMMPSKPSLQAFANIGAPSPSMWSENRGALGSMLAGSGHCLSGIPAGPGRGYKETAGGPDAILLPQTVTPATLHPFGNRQGLSS